jgi:hypothetical protein
MAGLQSVSKEVKGCHRNQTVKRDCKEWSICTLQGLILIDETSEHGIIEVASIFVAFIAD